MTARDDVLAAARALEQRGVVPWSPADGVAEAFRQGSTYPKSTLQTHIVSRLCVDAPENHDHRWPDLERVGHGQYRLRTNPWGRVERTNSSPSERFSLGRAGPALTRGSARHPLRCHATALRREGSHTYSGCGVAQRRRRGPRLNSSLLGGTVPYDLADKLVIGISSRALFDLDEAHAVFEEHGLEHYRSHQSERESDPLEPGTAMPLVRGLLRINDLLDERLVEVLIISRNDADTGVRVMNSAEHHGLDIPRWAFTDGRGTANYLRAFSCDLFLSANLEDVAAAAAQGLGAAKIMQVPDQPTDGTPEEVRIAFDGDAVLFSGESEAIHQAEGLEAFVDHETAHADEPLNPGPLKDFLSALSIIQGKFDVADSPIRMSLVTARNAPAHKRVITTLRHWGVRLNETFFLGGSEKAPVLEVLRPHIFFDDQTAHLEPARATTPAAQVPAEYVVEAAPIATEGPDDT